MNHLLTYLLTGVRCRATSVAKNSWSWWLLNKFGTNLLGRDGYVLNWIFCWRDSKRNVMISITTIFHIWDFVGFVLLQVFKASFQIAGAFKSWATPWGSLWQDSCQRRKMQRGNLVFTSFALILLPHQSIQVWIGIIIRRQGLHDQAHTSALFSIWSAILGWS